MNLLKLTNVSIFFVANKIYMGLVDLEAQNND